MVKALCLWLIRNLKTQTKVKKLALLVAIWCWGHDPTKYARESVGTRPEPHTGFPSAPAFAFPQFRTIWHQLCNSVFMVLIIHERELWENYNSGSFY